MSVIKATDMRREDQSDLGMPLVSGLGGHFEHVGYTEHSTEEWADRKATKWFLQEGFNITNKVVKTDPEDDALPEGPDKLRVLFKRMREAQTLEAKESGDFKKTINKSYGTFMREVEVRFMELDRSQWPAFIANWKTFGLPIPKGIQRELDKDFATTLKQEFRKELKKRA